MPRLNGTGPRGEGAMTGKGMGNCQGTAGARIGRSFRNGCRRGRRGFFNRTFGGFFGAGRITESEEKEMLREEAEILEKELEEVHSRLEDLEK